MPQVYHTYYSELTSDFSSIDVTQTGPAQTWDFSSVLPIGQDTLYAAPISSTPLAYQFFFNNVFLYPDHAADYAVPAMDLGTTGLSLSERYEYFRSDSQGQKIVGFGANIQGVPASVPYDVIDHIYDFPMNYTDSTVSNAEYLADVPGFGAYGQWITRTKKVDGWGTVITPTGTYNCLRVQTILEQIDTIYSETFMFGFTTPRPTDTIYDWVANGEGIPVFSAVVGAGGMQRASYKSSETNSVYEYDQMEVKLYPNPATDRITLETDQSGSIQITDLGGKVVFTSSYSPFESIDLTGLNAGFYQLTLISNNGARVSRKVEVVR